MGEGEGPTTRPLRVIFGRERRSRRGALGAGGWRDCSLAGKGLQREMHFQRLDRPEHPVWKDK